tara:strand:+ start:2716 stop:3363 length:648 start_codon:yes stop_codon:yes gene_type:complete
MVTTFVINLATRADRFEKFKKCNYLRWYAYSWAEIKDNDPMIDKMISYHNIRDTNQHLAKIGCWKSHMSLLEHIVKLKLDKVVVLEDDAVGMFDIDENNLLDNCITYLGGFFTSPKITETLNRDKLDIYYGVNLVDENEFKIMTTLAYYIPTWQLAKELYDQVYNNQRYRAIDVMYSQTTIPKAFVYPALFQEQRLDSDIRKNKKKFCDLYYKFV